MQYKIGGGNVIPSQMLKGVLEGCILKIISENETYGYEIVEKCKSYGLFDLSEGTIYPLLLRLERNALIQADYKQSPVGPKRKYFSITEKGRIEMEQFYGSWRELRPHRRARPDRRVGQGRPGRQPRAGLRRRAQGVCR